MAQGKEFLEVVEGLSQVVRVILEAGKDGYQTSDIAVVVTKLMLDPKMSKAFKGVEKIPEELKAYAADDYMSLFVLILKEVVSHLSTQLPAEKQGDLAKYSRVVEILLKSGLDVAKELKPSVLPIS